VADGGVADWSGGHRRRRSIFWVFNLVFRMFYFSSKVMSSNSKVRQRQGKAN